MIRDKLKTSQRRGVMSKFKYLVLTLAVIRLGLSYILDNFYGHACHCLDQILGYERIL
jgi:hypothetical protein